MSKIYLADGIFGLYWSLIVWPEFRDALMNTLFCNPRIMDTTQNAFVLFGNSCNWAFILLFVIPGIATALTVLVTISKILSWWNDR